MSTLTQSEFQQLITERSHPSLSLYMPTRASGNRDTSQEIIRLKNLLREATEKLGQAGLKSREVEAFLKPLEPLLIDTPFWSYQSDGLAIFLSPDHYRVFHLPRSFQEEVTVSDRFRLKPLLGLLNTQDRFDLLALSLNEVRLLECSLYGVSVVEEAEFPPALSEWAEQDRETHLQARSTASRGGGTRGSMIHGHGSTGEEKQELIAYMREVDKETVRLLRDSKTPVMLAGVDHVVGAYRDVSRYRPLLDDTLSGSPEKVHPTELYKRAWELFAPHLDKVREKVLARYKERKASGLAADTWEDIVPAVVAGRVESLLLGEGVTRPGSFNEETMQVELAPDFSDGTEDMAEFVALRAHTSGTAVHIVPRDLIPSRLDLVAVYRY